MRRPTVPLLVFPAALVASALVGLGGPYASDAVATGPCTVTQQGRDERGRDAVLAACVTEFADGFEGPLGFRIDGWHKVQLEGGPGNEVAPSSRQVHSGRSALRTATVGSRMLQKASLARELLWFPPHGELWFSGWFYVEGGTNPEDLFLFDVESTQGRGYPGRRLMLTGGRGRMLMLESKRAGPNFPQRGTPVLFPKDRWVHVVLHMALSSDRDGHTEVWQDGVKIIDARGKNLPADMVYNWIEVGITANPTRQPQVVYVDDITVSKAPIPWGPGP